MLEIAALIHRSVVNDPTAPMEKEEEEEAEMLHDMSYDLITFSLHVTSSYWAWCEGRWGTLRVWQLASVPTVLLQ